jgi:aquaporin Z
MLTREQQRPLLAEFVGSALLVFFAVGSVVLAGQYIGTVGIAFAFGLTILAVSYALGPVSGGHVNPAVTLGMFLDKRINLPTAVAYWIAQLAGAIVGACFLYLVAHQIPGLDTSGTFGTNGFGDRSAVQINTGGAFLAEILLTFFVVYVWLSVVPHVRAVRLGLPLGMAVLVVHLVGTPLTGTSINPARSIAPALFAGSDALTQIWLFIVAPLVGGALAALAYGALHPQRDREAEPEPAAG